MYVQRVLLYKHIVSLLILFIYFVMILVASTYLNINLLLFFIGFLDSFQETKQKSRITYCSKSKDIYIYNIYVYITLLVSDYYDSI